MKARAFAPAHVSGLFAVHDEADDPLAKGSRGAGWSLDLGATATVQEPSAERATARTGSKLADALETSIRINDQPAKADVTRLALRHLAPDARLDVDLQLDLPVGQGFGMSAAGSLAACLAAAHALGLEPEEALAAAHRAEVESGTGLGDAVASWHGAGEIRIRPGIPPHGHVLRIDAQARFLLAILGNPIPTPSIIRDAAWKERTRQLGDAAVDRILAAGRPMAWDAVLLESQRFSRELGLMPEPLAEAGAKLEGVKWGQCMLGSSMWVTGTPERLAQARRTLSGLQVFECGVDEGGARLLRA